MKQAVVFDMDGVVFDTEQIYFRAWKRAAEDIGFDADIMADVRVCMGKNHADIRAHFLGHYGPDFRYDDLMARRAHCIDELIAAEGLPLKPGVPGIFDWLHENGFAVALATSTNAARTQKYMDLSGIGEKFDCIISGDMVEHSKPCPDIYLKACEKLGVSPSHSVAVEDSPNGLRSGNAAGMTTVMIPDLVPLTDDLLPYVSCVCRDMEELKQFLRPDEPNS